MTEANLDSNPSPTVLASARPSRLKRLARKLDRVFAITVLLPTALSIVYFGFMASDVYISEARFVVRSPQRAVPTGLGALLQGTGFARSQDDTYSVHDYIRSRDALRQLDERLHVKTMFSRDGIDAASRFPAPWWRDDSFEGLFRHYQKHISVEYDSVSSISVLRVRAYGAEDSKQINETLLQLGESLVNNLNTRSRQDLIEVAQREVGVAEERAKVAALALSGFRSARGVYDPDRQSAVQLQSVAKLQEELLNAQAQLAQVRQVSPNNPQVETLAGRVRSLQGMLDAEAAKVTGKDAGSYASKSASYDRLALEKLFADRQLGAALASLEQARSEAARKQLYLERLVQPNLPDYPLEPRRLRAILVTLVVGLIAWGVISLVLATVREHTD